MRIIDILNETKEYWTSYNEFAHYYISEQQKYNVPFFTDWLHFLKVLGSLRIVSDKQKCERIFNNLYSHNHHIFQANSRIIFEYQLKVQIVALRRLRRRVFKLIRSLDQLARENSMQVAEYFTDTYTLNVVLGKFQGDRREVLGSKCTTETGEKRERKITARSTTTITLPEFRGVLGRFCSKNTMPGQGIENRKPMIMSPFMWNVLTRMQEKEDYLRHVIDHLS